jgi:hypothetical protein
MEVSRWGLPQCEFGHIIFESSPPRKHGYKALDALYTLLPGIFGGSRGRLCNISQAFAEVRGSIVSVAKLTRQYQSDE